MSSNREVIAIARRMRVFFIGTGLTSASREMVEKWARELETIASLKTAVQRDYPRGDDGRQNQ